MSTPPHRLADEDLVGELADEASEGAEEWIDGALLWAAFRTVVVVAFVATVGVFAWQELFAGPSAPSVVVEPAREAASAAAVDEVEDDVSRHGGAGRELVITAGGQGHYEVRAQVDGAEVDFLVDTGASKVFLSLGDAERVGLDADLLEFTDRFRTANGTVYGAPVTLREIRVGDLLLRDVEATVTRSRLPISLLGMTFLGRLDGYEVRDGVLILKY